MRLLPLELECDRGRVAEVAVGAGDRQRDHSGFAVVARLDRECRCARGARRIERRGCTRREGAEAQGDVAGEAAARRNRDRVARATAWADCLRGRGGAEAEVGARDREARAAGRRAGGSGDADRACRRARGNRRRDLGVTIHSESGGRPVEHHRRCAAEVAAGDRHARPHGPARRRKRRQRRSRRRRSAGGGEVIHVHVPLAERVAEGAVADADAAVLGVDVSAVDA